MAETAPVRKKKMPAALKAVLVTLLVLVLFAAVFIALTYVYITGNPIEYDDVPALVSAAPMPFAQRWSIRAEPGEALILIDKSDIHWLFEREDSMTNVIRSFTDLGCTTEGYAINITNGGLAVSFGLNYKGRLTVPIHMIYGVSIEDEYITAAVKELYLGPAIKLPADKICAMAGISAEQLLIRVRRDIAPRLQYLKGITIGEGALTLACSIGSELFEDALRFDTAIRTAYPLLNDRCTYRVVSEYNLSPSTAALTEALRKCESDPGYLVALRTEQLAFAGNTAQKAFFNHPCSPYRERFFPGVTSEAVAQAQAALDAAKGERYLLFTSLAKRLSAARNSGALTFGRQGFLFESSPLSIPAFSGDEWQEYEAWLEPDALYFYPGIYKRDAALILRPTYGQPLCAYWYDKLGTCLFPGVDGDDAAFSMPGEIPEYFF